MRMVLFVTNEAVYALEAMAGEKQTSLGLEVTREQVARSLIYRGLGFSPAGYREGGGGAPPAITLAELEEAKGWVDELLDRSSKKDPVLMADNLTDLLKRLAGVG